jgi:hypothetical protein
MTVDAEAKIKHFVRSQVIMRRQKLGIFAVSSDYEEYNILESDVVWPYTRTHLSS